MPEHKTISFGRYLKSVRLEKGIDLKTVSSRTRIGLDTLRFIEEEDHDRLPAEVFVKGFLRAYAREIDADGDEVVSRYAAGRHMLAAAARVESDRIRSSARFWPRFMATMAVFCLIVAISVGLLTPHEEPPVPVPDTLPADTGDAATLPASGPKAPAPPAPAPPAPELSAPETPDTETKPSPPAVVDEIPPVVSAPPGPPVRAVDTHLLEIRAVDETWMKVIVDNLASREMTLRPGDRLELEARSGFNLLIGNAAGILVFLDGKPVSVPGKSGQVITLQLP
jgi:cytoskeleton protein RodZ